MGLEDLKKALSETTTKENKNVDNKKKKPNLEALKEELKKKDQNQQEETSSSDSGSTAGKSESQQGKRRISPEGLLEQQGVGQEQPKQTSPEQQTNLVAEDTFTQDISGLSLDQTGRSMAQPVNQQNQQVESEQAGFQEGAWNQPVNQEQQELVIDDSLSEESIEEQKRKGEEEDKRLRDRIDKEFAFSVTNLCFSS